MATLIILYLAVSVNVVFTCMYFTSLCHKSKPESTAEFEQPLRLNFQSLYNINELIVESLDSSYYRF